MHEQDTFGRVHWIGKST